MTRLRFIVPLLILAAFIRCEKDDICDGNTPTTPRLIISFFDVANPSIPKSVNQLRVVGEGQSEELEVFNGVNTIEVPLRTTDDFTQYRFILNSTSPGFENEDVLLINYSRDNIYISRACGYKTVFSTAENNPVIHSDGAANDGFWMQDVILNQTEIQNEDDTHISILF